MEVVGMMLKGQLTWRYVVLQSSSSPVVSVHWFVDDTYLLQEIAATFMQTKTLTLVAWWYFVISIVKLFKPSTVQYLRLHLYLIDEQKKKDQNKHNLKWQDDI